MYFLGITWKEQINYAHLLPASSCFQNNTSVHNEIFKDFKHHLKHPPYFPGMALTVIYFHIWKNGWLASDSDQILLTLALYLPYPYNVNIVKKKKCQLKREKLLRLKQNVAKSLSEIVNSFSVTQKCNCKVMCVINK